MIILSQTTLLSYCFLDNFFTLMCGKWLFEERHFDFGSKSHFHSLTNFLAFFLIRYFFLRWQILNLRNEQTDNFISIPFSSTRGVSSRGCAPNPLEGYRILLHLKLFLTEYVWYTWKNLDDYYEFTFLDLYLPSFNITLKRLYELLVFENL